MAYLSSYTSTEVEQAISLALTSVQKLTFSNIGVNAEDFAADSSYEAYPYKASIPLAGVLAASEPRVVFSPTEANSWNFSPVCETYDGGVYIWAKTKPGNAIVIPQITILKEG